MNINKVFGIGLSRTATHSLNEALNILGYNVIHYPTDEKTYNELAFGNYNLSILEEYDGITDITVAPFYAQLDDMYPNSIFILTIRNVNDWHRSLKKHYDNRNKLNELYKNTHRSNLRKFFRASVYGTYQYNYDRMDFVFHQHYDNVTKYFKYKPNQLLILDIPRGDGWEKLCPFLECDIPSRAFPNWNYAYQNSSCKP